MIRHEILTRAREIWLNDTGPLAAGAVFKCWIENGTPPKIILQADCDKVGRKGSMMTRCVRMLPFEVASESNLRDCINELYSAMSESIFAAAGLGVKF